MPAFLGVLICKSTHNTIQVRTVSMKMFVHFYATHIGGSLVPKLCFPVVTSWAVACQTPLTMGFSRQEYWSGLPFHSPGDFPNSGTEPGSPALQAVSLLSHQGSPCYKYQLYWNWCICVNWDICTLWANGQDMAGTLRAAQGHRNATSTVQRGRGKNRTTQIKPRAGYLYRSLIETIIWTSFPGHQWVLQIADGECHQCHWNLHAWNQRHSEKFFTEVLLKCNAEKGGLFGPETLHFWAAPRCCRCCGPGNTVWVARN